MEIKIYHYMSGNLSNDKKKTAYRAIQRRVLDSQGNHLDILTGVFINLFGV